MLELITRSYIRCSLDDTQAAQLPPPDGPPVYKVDALADSGHNLHDILGRMFGRPHWKREHASHALSCPAIVTTVATQGKT
jgi:hypothetical protein